jgi:hypothetical protein
LTFVSGVKIKNINEVSSHDIYYHDWLAFFLLIITALTFFYHKKIAKIICIFISILVLSTGLVSSYGLGFFTRHIKFSSEDFKQNNIAFDQQAMAFNSSVLPILEHKCVKCHSQDNRKAGLAFDSLDDFLKGAFTPV